MFDKDQFQEQTRNFKKIGDQARLLYMGIAKTALSQIKLLIPNLVDIRWTNEHETGDEGQTYTCVTDIVLELTPDDNHKPKIWSVRNVELLQNADFTDAWEWDEIADDLNDALQANPHITDQETDALAASLIQKRYGATGIQTKQSVQQLAELLDWLITALQQNLQDCECLSVEMVDSLASPLPLLANAEVD